MADAVEAEVRAQLADLPTAQTAVAALENGFAVVAADLVGALSGNGQLTVFAPTDDAFWAQQAE